MHLVSHTITLMKVKDEDLTHSAGCSLEAIIPNGCIKIKKKATAVRWNSTRDGGKLSHMAHSLISHRAVLISNSRGQTGEAHHSHYQSQPSIT